MAAFLRRSLATNSLLLTLLGLTPPAGAAPTTASPPPIAEDAAVDQAFDAFFDARRSRAISKAIDRILALGVDVADVDRRLALGPTYSSTVERGILVRTRKGPFHYTLYVPESYDPAKRYPLHVMLHGGVARPAFRRDGSWFSRSPRMLRDDRIALAPAGWIDAMWWHDAQVENLSALIRDVAQEYNIDRSQVHLRGMSDGGTGAMYQALRDADPWASLISLIGHVGVLANPAVGAEGDFYSVNLSNRPVYIVNGGKDPLYPIPMVVAWLDLFQRAGTSIIFSPKPEAGHDLSFLDEEHETLLEFAASHPRPAWPNRIRWETSDLGRASGIDGIEILKLGKTSSDAQLVTPNMLRASLETVITDEGGRGDGKTTHRAFRHRKASGRVDLDREDAQIELRTRGVQRLRLDLPLELALRDDLEIVINGQVIHRGEVVPQAETLLRRFAETRDRSRRVAAELELVVPGA